MFLYSKVTIDSSLLRDHSFSYGGGGFWGEIRRFSS